MQNSASVYLQQFTSIHSIESPKEMVDSIGIHLTFVELTATLNNDSNIDTDKLTQIESTIATNDPYQNSQTPLLQKPEMWRRMLIHRALYGHLKLSHIPYCFAAAEMGLDLIENRKKLGWTFLTQQVSL